MHLDDAIARLVAWELVDEAAVVGGEVEVSSLPRRNLNLRVEQRRGPGLLIKQPDAAIPESRDTLRAESSFYAFCHDEPRAAAAARWMPRVRFADRDVLAIEWVDGARPLWDEYQACDAEELPTAPSRALGEALGTLHATFESPRVDTDARLADLHREPPAFLDVHRPHPSVLRRLSPAQGELLRWVQGEAAICEGLAKACADWRATTVIHGDVRFDNVLALAADDGTEVRLVDWELVQRGDPAYDVAGALAGFAQLWLLGMPLESDLDAGERVAAARYPLAAVHPAMSAFWRAYRAAAGRSEAAADDLLGRAVLDSGAVLLQTAWEFCHRHERPTSVAVLLLQLAANLFADPVRRARDLYGLELGLRRGR